MESLGNWKKRTSGAATPLETDASSRYQGSKSTSESRERNRRRRPNFRLRRRKRWRSREALEQHLRKSSAWPGGKREASGKAAGRFRLSRMPRKGKEWKEEGKGCRKRKESSPNPTRTIFPKDSILRSTHADYWSSYVFRHHDR